MTNKDTPVTQEIPKVWRDKYQQALYTTLILNASFLAQLCPARAGWLRWWGAGERPGVCGSLSALGRSGWPEEDRQGLVEWDWQQNRLFKSEGKGCWTRVQCEDGCVVRLPAEVMSSLSLAWPSSDTEPLCGSKALRAPTPRSGGQWMRIWCLLWHQAGIWASTPCLAQN